MSGPRPLRVLVVDDEPPALGELAYLLGRDPRVGRVSTAGDGATALGCCRTSRSTRCSSTSGCPG